METPRAWLADAHLGRHPRIRLQLGVSQDDRGVASWAALGRQEVQLQPDGAEAGFNRHVPRREKAIARVLHFPHGFLGGGHEAPVPVLLDESAEAVANLVHAPQHELIDVMYARHVAGAKRARRHSLDERDAALDLRRNALGCLWVARIGRMGVERGGAGNADCLRAELARVHLDHCRGQCHCCVLAFSWQAYSPRVPRIGQSRRSLSGLKGRPSGTPMRTAISEPPPTWA